MAQTNKVAAPTSKLADGACVLVYDAPGVVLHTCASTGQIAVHIDGERTWHYWSAEQVVEVVS